jgi:TetR/AcrR family transcriptional repressor of nem operon
MVRSRQSEGIRMKLLDQGIAMFIDRGYHGTGIKEVVDKVGIPKGSFYNYFKSKEDFASEVIEQYWENFKVFMSNIVRDSEIDAHAALERLFDDLIKEYEDKNCKGGCLLGNLAAEITDGSELGRKTISKCANQWRDMLKAVVSKGQEQKCIRDDVRADDIADFLLNSLEGSVLRMKMEANTAPLMQLKEIFLSYITKE